MREPLAQDEQIADAVDRLRGGFRGHRGVERPAKTFIQAVIIAGLTARPCAQTACWRSS